MIRCLRGCHLAGHEALKKTAEHLAAQPRKSEETEKVVEMSERSATAASK